MNSLSRCIIIFLLFCTRNAAAQLNIQKAWIDADPVKQGSSAPAAEKIKLHEIFLKAAVSNNDIPGQFYGNLYLFTDYMDEQKYTLAIPFLLTAEKLADGTGNINWQGFLQLRKGWVASIIHNDLKTAVQEFKAGVDLSSKANDTLCAALCLEQISTMYIGLNNFDSSQYYFDKAMPVLRRSAIVTLNGTYNNHSCMLVSEGKHEAALLYNDSAIQIVKQQKNKRKEVALLTNRAMILCNLKRYDSAEAIFKYCMAVDEENKWTGNLMYDYQGISLNYHKKGNDAAAYDYLNKYDDLKDSLAGISVNFKVANIEAANKAELNKLAAAKAIQKRNRLIAMSALLLLCALLFRRMQYSRAKKEQLKNKAGLAELTRILLEKNTQLISLEEQVYTLNKQAPTAKGVTGNDAVQEEVMEAEQDGPTANEQPDFEGNLYNQRILTAEDWAAFKIYFEKAYRGYLLRLRNAYTNLTEAEERMFLLIKLNLTNKETAAILGISADSVKKTRSRLKKRLVLKESEELDDFVLKF